MHHMEEITLNKRDYCDGVCCEETTQLHNLINKYTEVAGVLPYALKSKITN